MRGNRVTVSPADVVFFRQHPDEALVAIEANFTKAGIAMAVSAPAEARAAMSIANAAWAELARRKEAA